MSDRNLPSEENRRLVLGIETSCDDSSVALIRDGILVGQLVSSQTTIHEEYGGVVPELATRQHLQNLLPLTTELFRQTGGNIHDVALVAATRGPGLPNALRTGFTFGQSMAIRLKADFFGIHHHEAHLFSSFLNGNPPELQLGSAHFPFISLIVSGGHTLLVLVRDLGDYQVLGKTIDDAAGECFDKVAKLMGFPYPGGPHIDALARIGNPNTYRFPRPMINDPGFDFSFSGLKTAVRYFLRDHPGAIEHEDSRADLCAGIQAAIVEVLTARTIQACRKFGIRRLSAAGGVIANRGLRESLEVHSGRHGIEFHPSSMEFCTDNAAMVAAVGYAKWMRHGRGDDSLRQLETDIRPSWPIEESGEACPVGGME